MKSHCAWPPAERKAAGALRCQYVYLCAGKASKLSTCSVALKFVPADVLAVKVVRVSEVVQLLGIHLVVAARQFVSMVLLMI